MRSSMLGLRALSTTVPRLNSTPPSTASTAPTAPTPAVAAAPEGSSVLATYEGPLARTFTRLKLFSLGSLGLASILTPILLLAPGEISLAGRVGLSITALATSGVSTALIAWIGTPYVGSMRLLKRDGKVGMELNTVSWRLRPQRTLVYEPTFLRPTSRPFAAWEIANSAPTVTLGQGESVEKLVAETFDVKSGASLGKWIAKWDGSARSKDGEEWKAVGRVEVKGRPTRYFNVHEELLGDDWQVLG
ncbi:hypothetical protein PSEUBRA_003939 [Kalmanozyma brasiliensis GHG001]|uniref:uncharacterized protein n=1 Tax=Kalmanozyma brasiliensis (strain GHG001) TaxID=1365824 RepID=UPI00286836E5|nr:uncharacterized protein PSEUBRA_003939 [Kalmanozyma brasiliensis GHG001]KAF6767315.1 hypothetical protein PSEUBRA_003939 [Kalmanozyma brasiliensis GHG001]